MESLPNAWRLFVAIALPEAVKIELQHAQEELRAAVSDPRAVRWTRPEQFHITLKFLGNVDSTTAGAVAAALRRGVDGWCAMRLAAEKIGFFPHPRFPHVIWAGIRDDQRQLEGLQAKVQSAVGLFASEDRAEPFTGHVTLGRCQGIRRAGAEALFQAAKGMEGRSFGEWEANEVELIRSELGSGGARYTAVATIALG